jgi:arginase
MIRDDPEGAARQALEELQRHARRILLHFEVDVIDSTDVPPGDFPHSMPACRLTRTP